LSSRTLLTAAAVAAAYLSTAPSSQAQSPKQFVPPPSLVAQALCIHAGVLFQTTRAWKGEPVSYVLWRRAYFRSHRYDDVTSGPGPNGEGGWNTLTAASLGYAGGMSFTLGTYNRAADLLGLPHARDLAAVAAASPADQIAHAVAIRQQDGDWSEWPSTSRSCGYL